MITTIAKRRSVFPAQFSTVAVTKEQIAQLLAAANWAPSHRKTEPWRFKVMQGVTLEKLGVFMANTYTKMEPKPKQVKIQKLRTNPTKASAVIAICMQRDPAESVPEWEEVAATAMAVQNLWLAATEMGLGGYWSSPSLIKHMGDFLPMAEGERCLGFFYLGNYDGEIAAGVRQPIADKTVWL